MLVVIKSGPESQEAKRAVKIARDTAADIVLIQNAVSLARGDRLEGFCGTAFAVSEDLMLRGIKDLEKSVKEISYEEFIDLMANSDKVIGIF
jgi:sulfur relay protein TusB/DsrH